jgi:uncharacterized membrane protein YphA (DoxX/SURF4 family)
MNLPFPIPIQVLYAGLAGTVFALLVATATNRWSLKVFFLLALRMAIGWHFLFEGLHKIHSHYIGPSETNRPFTSEVYFTAGEGPLAKEMRARIGHDPEKDLQAKLTPQNADKLAALPPRARVDRHAGAGGWLRPNGEPYESFPDFLKNREKGLSDAERRELNDQAKGDEYMRKAAKEYAERQVADLEAFAKMAPAEVCKDWADFVKAIGDKYKFSPEEVNKVNGMLDEKEREQLVAGLQAAETADAKERKALLDKAGPGDITLTALAAYGRWAVGVEPRGSKLKFVSGDTPLTAPERLEYIEHRKAEVAELEKRANDKLGVGHGHEMNRMKDAKAVITLARSALLTDADDFLTELKKGAVAETIGKRFAKKAPGPAVAFGGLDPDPNAPTPTDEQVKKADEQRAAKLDVLVAFPAPAEPTFANLPPDIKAVWERYLAEFKATYPMDEKATKAADEAYGLITARLANWYHDRDEFSAKPGKPGFTALLKKYEGAKARASGPELETVGVFEGMVRSVRANGTRNAAYAGLEQKYTDLKSALTAAIPAEVVAGPVTEPTKKSKFLESLDWQTRWGITAIGIMLLAGLFTRIACLAGFAFLVLTYLTHPPFPWLALPPGTEGNPVFVNKNVIEALALLVIMVHPTGRWLGIDAVIHRVFFRNSKEYLVPVESEPAKTKAARR